MVGVYFTPEIITELRENEVLSLARILMDGMVAVQQLLLIETLVLFGGRVLVFRDRAMRFQQCREESRQSSHMLMSLLNLQDNIRS